MKIFAISAVKNEADVIESNLLAASKWAHKIFVLDNGSTDGTWEKVLAMQNDIITPYKQDASPFRESIRSGVYNHYRHLSSPGDWWCIKLDADEFYHDDPRTFLKAVSSRYHFVCAKYIQFQMTEEDVAEHHFSGDFAHDRPFIQYYGKSAWSEIRFVRFRRRLTWPSNANFPKDLGIVYPKLITMLHYQYRSPRQIQVRLDVRHAAKAHGYLADHVTAHSWKEVLMKRSELHSLQDNIDLSTIPVENNYLHKPHILLIKKVLHGLKILP